jgi:hypothetical protein
MTTRDSAPPLLSLCVIARDEAATLERCLRSAEGCVDEAWVLDTGSTDDTAAIARACGAEVVPFAWCDDFSAARNAAIERARGRFVLVLDADEYLEPGAGAALRERVARDEVDGLRLVVRNLTPPGELLAWTEIRLTRVFRNDPRFRYEGRIHEQIGPSIAQAGGRVDDAELRVVHTGYQTSAAQGGSRAERNLRALDAALRDQPSDPYLWYQWGVTQKARGDLALARTGLERALNAGADHLGPDIAAPLRTRLSQACWGLGDASAAHGHAAAALHLRPDDPLALALWGLTGVELGRGVEVVPALRRAATAEAVAPSLRAELSRLADLLGARRGGPER